MSSNEDRSVAGSSLDDPDPVAAGLAIAVNAVIVTGLVALAAAGQPGLSGPDGASVNVGLGTVSLWMFYAAHGVPMLFSNPEWAFTGGLVGSPLVYLVPPVILAAGGFGLVRMFGAESLVGAVKRGASIAVGYVICAAGGLAIATYSIGASFASLTVRPDPVWAIGVAVAYPLVFGSVGAAAAYLGSVALDDSR